MKAETSDVDRAHAVYTRRGLAFYDWWVLGVSNRWIWKCDTQKILDLYQAHLSTSHLEVGVGTGYFLEKSLSNESRRVTLFDINLNCLERASKRIAGHHPEVFQGNILEPVNLQGGRYDSIAINYLLHCLPSRLEEKAEKVFHHLIPHLDNDGVVFGSTILGMDIQRPLLARLLMSFYNSKGIFSNQQDSLGAMMEVLSKRFRTFNVEVCGCVVLFWGKGLRETYRNRYTGEQ